MLLCGCYDRRAPGHTCVVSSGASPRAAHDASPTPGLDGASPGDGGDVAKTPASPMEHVDGVAPVPPRHCGWCETLLLPEQERWCSKRCRQTAWRARRLSVAEDLRDTPKRIAVADPPFPGLAKRYYGKEPTYAGEVDHRKLVASLEYSYDGWALCTSAKALREVLILCPPDARVCAWVKPGGVSSKTRGLHNRWEPVIVRPARLRRPGKVDWIETPVARGGDEDLMGRKPPIWCAWLFDVLGASPAVDTLDDIFPGTGVVTRVWRQLKEKALQAREVRCG